MNQKKILSETETITLPKVWFEKLLKNAKRTDELLGEDNVQIRIDYHIVDLLGYIESIEHLIEHPEQQKERERFNLQHHEDVACDNLNEVTLEK